MAGDQAFGVLDEFAIYNYALTQAQISAHYNLTNHPRTPALPITITSATLGTNTVNCNAAGVAATTCNGQISCSIPVAIALCNGSDPAPGIWKKLTVNFTCGGNAMTVAAMETDTAYLSCP